MHRRFHKKSRNGCNQCKERRVKCDETRPLCSACTARELPCVYSTPCPRRYSPTETSLKPEPKPPAKPAFISPKYHAQHLLLMHKFSTETYKSICGDHSDIEGWQVLIPKLAFEHEFLLHGIFAIAALHMAATNADPEQVLSYLDTALQCNELAFAPFREALAHLTPLNCDAVFAQSAIVTIIGIALPRLNAQHRGESFSMIETMMTVFELLQGASKISQISKPWRQASIFFKYDWRENTTLDPDVANAIAQLRMLNGPIESTDSAQNSINQEAIDSLEDSFAKFTNAPHPAPILAWLTYVKREFVHGLRERQPFQLLILMNWAVLLNELEASFWWAKGCGKALVAELLSELKDHNEKWKSALQWPQQMVGI
ncbi:hypothetical protein N7489_004238 [Penicillium chrysogenum]|uniref:Zn(2)-C6 fungal-type domain-containing protein n=1 Tax=Penicillium chrysogenum TaxID=5076 RepID=A0ABQ8WRD9_PENCH|nr:uncharacterized protein N7489_004238 [Penicillium chrysogenum]KAJ5244142.1 hypothetical protein N7489_004238 [Penicillium chrysogenum]KAJ5275229.1 hypothetical protein N7505_003774 [Penicillium chrysogenum]KAJ5285727.1 hypothetical protein N7524_001033 [Penicillium chrysogenum]KAJ6156960.1 hypothetical protein N7497_005845 [Penicillium chrysogenum]